MRFLLILRISTEDTPCTRRPQAIYCTTTTHRKKKKQRRERNHRLFLAAGLLIEAGLVDTKTGELCYKKDRILQALKELKYDLETSPNPDA
ncbi:hypothetical protein BE940_00025 (plasmid) [Escherichia coli]|nr:hypothetical protein BE940_00025 [Escherichia coli]